MAIKSDKLLDRPSELHRRYSGRLAMQKSLQEKMVGGASGGVVLSKKSIKSIEIMKSKVTQIESILKGTLAVEKKELDNKKRLESGKRREKQEEKLETKPNVESGQVKMPSAPKLGILDWIKNFIGNVLLGYFAVRLIDHLPKIIPVLQFLGNAADFIIDIGGKLLDGLATLLDAGYKAYDATRGFIKNFGGEKAAQKFDKFVGTIDTVLFLTTALAADLLRESSDSTRRDRARRRAAASVVAGDEQPVRQRPTVTTGQGGKPAGPRIPGTGPRVTGSGAGAGGAGGGKFKLPSRTSIRSGGIAALVMLIPDIINSGMLMSQGRPKDGIRTFLSAVAGVGAGMAAVAGVTAGAAALGITGVGIPAAIALAIAGFAASSLAGSLAYEGTDALLRKMGLVDKDPKTGKPYAYRSGGITRGGKAQGGVKRAIGGVKKKGVYKRTLAKNPTQTRFKTTDKKVKEVSENLDKTQYFGPILSVAAKVMENEKPDKKDYENAGLGLNLLIAKGIEDGQLKGGLVAAFAEGGMVDDEFLSAAEKGSDISNWIARTFNRLFESRVEQNLRLIKERQMRKGSLDKEEGKGQPGADSNLEVEPGGTVTGGNADFWALVAIASLESGHPQGRADVAQVLYNRLASGVYTGKTLKELIVAKNQFQPTREGDPKLWAAISDKQSAIAALNSHPRGKNGAKMIEESASAIQNPALQKSAAEFVGGRTDFAQPGAAQRYPGGFGFIERHGHLFGWYVGPASIAYGKKNPGPARAPQLGDIVVMGGGAPGTGGTLGGGKFIQGNSGASAGVHFHIGPGSQAGGTILQKQYFGDARATAKQAIDYFLSKGSRVYDGRRGVYYKSGNEVDAAQRAHTASGSAGGIDMQVDFEKPVPFPLKTTAMAYRRNGFGVSADIMGSNSFVAHGRFDEKGNVAPQERMKLYAKGGRVRKLTRAILGEKGPEFVFDADTTAGLDRLAPQLLERLNMAKTKPQLSSILQSYTDYEQSYAEPEIREVPVPMPFPLETGGGGSAPAMSGFSGGGGDDYAESLYKGG